MEFYAERKTFYLISMEIEECQIEIELMLKINEILKWIVNIVFVKVFFLH